MVKIALVTPARDELANLKRQFAQFGAMSQVEIDWFIVENSSTDGSRELVDQLQDVGSLHVIPMHWNVQGEYSVGFRYSEIVSYGIERALSTSDADYVGICDADCFPSSEYFLALIRAFEADPKLGLTSGVGVSNGKGDQESERHVRGNCRLWRRRCLEVTGFPVVPSPDSVSKFLALRAGWRVYPVLSAVYECRELGARGSQAFYGWSAAYRGVSFSFAIFKTLRLTAQRGLAEGRNYLRGYLKNCLIDRQRLADKDLRKMIHRQSVRDIATAIRKRFGLARPGL